MQIPVDSIDITSGFRHVDPAKIDLLALSIKSNGLFNPILVVENTEVRGRYFMVAGRNRLNAVKNKLGWQNIEGTVKQLTEIDRQLVELGENLCRSDYTPIEHATATARFASLYAAAHPEVKDYLENVRDKQTRNLKRGESAPAKAEAAAETALANAPTPTKAVAKQFGVTTRKVERDIKRATAFTDEEKVVLADRKLTGRRLDELVAIPDRADTAQVINLLGAGMAFESAMKEVLGDRYVGGEDDDEEDPLSDEQFLAGCPAREKANRSRFDADALFYRAIQKQKLQFGKSIGWSAIKAKIGEMGIYARRLLLFFDAKHPRDWLTCPNCRMGVNQGGECKTCKGGGYLLG